MLNPDSSITLPQAVMGDSLEDIFSIIIKVQLDSLAISKMDLDPWKGTITLRSASLPCPEFLVLDFKATTQNLKALLLRDVV
jgi:hypothetical protein